MQMMPLSTTHSQPHVRVVYPWTLNLGQLPILICYVTTKDVHHPLPPFCMTNPVLLYVPSKLGRLIFVERTCVNCKKCGGQGLAMLITRGDIQHSDGCLGALSCLGGHADTWSLWENVMRPVKLLGIVNCLGNTILHAVN